MKLRALDNDDGMQNLEMLMILMVLLLRRNVLYSQVNKIYNFTFYSKFQSRRKYRTFQTQAQNIFHLPLPISGEFLLFTMNYFF